MNRYMSRVGTRARSRGVTLLELMAVVVIIGVLGTLAVNSYRGYLLRANRTEARVALLRVQAAQEKFFLQNNRYADTAELTPGPADGGLGIAATTPNGQYAISLDSRRYDVYGQSDGTGRSDEGRGRVSGARDRRDRKPYADR